MRRILLIDDDPEVQDLLAAALVGAFLVTAVTDWTQVNQHVFHAEVDLILMDVNMPVIRGDTLTKILTRSGRDLKIVLFSAMDEAELRKLARSVEAYGYIQKTFDRQVLVHKLSRFISRARAGTGVVTASRPRPPGL